MPAFTASTNGEAQAAFVSAASAAGIVLDSLSAQAQIQLVLANLLAGETPVAATGYTVNGNAGASGTGGTITDITVENGLVTAITVS